MKFILRLFFIMCRNEKSSTNPVKLGYGSLLLDTLYEVADAPSYHPISHIHQGRVLLQCHPTFPLLFSRFGILSSLPLVLSNPHSSVL